MDLDKPGLFLQGLATYGPDGEPLPGPTLQLDIVRACFEYSQASGIACTAFLGDDCVTTWMDEHLKELHERYFEPLAQVHAPTWSASPYVSMLLCTCQSTPLSSMRPVVVALATFCVFKCS